MKLIPDDFQKEINLRISNIRKKLSDQSVEAVLIGSSPNIYYTSGRFFRGYTLIPLTGDPLWFVIKPTDFSQQPSVDYIRKPEQIPDILREKGYPLPSKIALEFDDLSYSDICRLEKVFPESLFYNGSAILRQVREVKTPWEIEQMKEDGNHQVKVYSKVSDCYKPGMTDLELQIEIERELRLEGALGVLRVSGNLMEINMGSVISGDNADNSGPYEFTMTGSGVHPSLPVGADNHRILPGHTVMVDMNGTFNGYQTDMTRVWSLGTISPLAMKAHNCSIKILRILEKKAVPGIPVSELYNTALSIVKEEELEPYFMGHNNKVGFIGHGVGIQLNEAPVVNARSKELLEENMTIALEPKFVIPHTGAVGVENTYRVTASGLENLTIFPEDIRSLDL